MHSPTKGIETKTFVGTAKLVNPALPRLHSRRRNIMSEIEG